MAFIDVDEVGDYFANISNRVGTTGNKDDVLLVQALLEVIYKGKVWNPVRHITVTGIPASDTIILIKYFQKTVLNRKNPQGYVNRSSGQNTDYSTIWKLNRNAELSLGVPSILAYLRAKSPILKASLPPMLDTPKNLDPDFPIPAYIR
jgi:hypothetical protein